MASISRLLLLFLIYIVAVPARAEEITIAAAANFTAAMKDIVKSFEEESGHEVNVSFASSGLLFAQISNGAPYQVFFSADQMKPAALEENGLAVRGSRFTYAVGTLVLWSADPTVDVKEGNALRGHAVEKLAIANPRLAPYGVAAVEVLENLGLMEVVRNRLVRGENITQTYQFVDTGNADAGFVALSQVVRDGKIARGSGWIVPAGLYSPVRQDAVLLNHGKDSPAAREFFEYMHGGKAREIIAAYGYRTE